MTVSVRRRKRAERIATHIVDLRRQVELENLFRRKADGMFVDVPQVPRTSHAPEMVAYCDNIRNYSASRAYLAASLLRTVVRQFPMSLKRAWRLVDVREVMES